jgi:hypothetical protein
MHLLGDLSQPLHAGYGDDLGGNSVAFQFDTLKTNLHKFWDEEIIRRGNISLQDCLDLYQHFGNKPVDTIEGVSPVLWMNESRSLLNKVYNYEGFTGDNQYLTKNKEIVKRQLLIAGLRLAAILNKIFISDTPEINMKSVASNYKDGIEAKDALLFVGKKMTVCGRVYGIRTTDKVTLINLGDKYPNSPLTIAIFAKDRKNFSMPVDELFANKNICVKGEIVTYNGKAEIIVTRPEEIWEIK